MNWTELLKTHADEAYRTTEGLMTMVTADDLDWKPDSGENWMTTGQLLKHLTDACGATCRGFVTGDWGMPEGVDITEMPPEAMLPQADAMAAVGSVEEALEALAADKRLAYEMIDQAADRMEESSTAPWDPHPVPLGRQLMRMVGHLNNHKGQLFYYLKLQGKPVNTMHYYGMT